MLTAIAAAILAPAPLEGIGEFFPLNPGDQWTYTEESDVMTTTTTDTVGEPIEMSGKKVFPIVTANDGKEVDRVYYWVGEGVVQVVGFKKDEPIVAPYAVLKSPDLGDRWSFKGETVMQGVPADLKLEGRVKKAGQVEFEGRKVDALEVRLEATILEEFGTKVTTTQVATYGRGIGLLKMESTAKLPRKTVRMVRKLVAYRPIKT
jgi:hypothetical protein